MDNPIQQFQKKAMDHLRSKGPIHSMRIGPSESLEDVPVAPRELTTLLPPPAPVRTVLSMEDRNWIARRNELTVGDLRIVDETMDDLLNRLKEANRKPQSDAYACVEAALVRYIIENPMIPMKVKNNLQTVLGIDQTQIDNFDWDECYPVLSPGGFVVGVCDGNGEALTGKPGRVFDKANDLFNA